MCVDSYCIVLGYLSDQRHTLQRRKSRLQQEWVGSSEAKNRDCVEKLQPKVARLKFWLDRRKSIIICSVRKSDVLQRPQIFGPKPLISLRADCRENTKAIGERGSPAFDDAIRPKQIGSPLLEIP
jgi:hypothetical protein